MSAWVVLTAAGMGTRLGADQPKALTKVGEQTILGLALVRITASTQVDGVVITCPPKQESAFQAVVDEARGAAGRTRAADVPVAIVAGGNSRQGSVMAGLQEVRRQLAGNPNPAMPVLVHDAARCLTPTETFDCVIEAVGKGAPAVIPVLPVVDTITRIDPATGLVIGSLDRQELRTVQTPQGFRWDVLYRVHVAEAERSASEASAATDDATLVQDRGAPVVTVPGSSLAMKITLPEDVRRAESLLAEL